MRDFIDDLRVKLQQPLPGREAQLKMAPSTRRKYAVAPPDVRHAGVLATLFPKNEEWHVVLIQRNTSEKDRHGGQIGFPGGKAEPDDGTMLNTALREVEEEVGILRSEIKVLGGLSELYIPVSNFQVHPFVGYLERQPSYTLQVEEVSGVLEVPLSHFQSEASRRTTDIPINRMLTMKNVPYFDVDGQILWGATAMMMSELVEVVRSEK